MGASSHFLFVVVVTWLGCRNCNAEFQLNHLSTMYLPYSYTPIPEFVYDKDVAEQNAYDPEKGILYVVGNELIHVIDISDLTEPTVVYYQTVQGGEMTDVETCGDFLAVTVDNQVDPLDGKVVVFRGFQKNMLEKLHEITVGALPDMLKFTSDCSKIVVALEGELRMVNGDVVDPEGGVAIISFLEGQPSGQYHLQIANFTHFNDRADEYIERGVRWVYRGEGAGINSTFSQDLEPEYVAINADDTKAFIVLQENNAIAEVDILSGTIEELYSLGYKSWQSLTMDASDRDDGINLENWPLRGLYQPDALKHVTIGGQGYILTANEGEEKEYELDDFPFEFMDGRKGSYFVENDLLHDSVPESLREALYDDSELGRLRLSTLDGLEADGRHSHLYAYGGRSFSVWQESDLSLVYDSGDDVERRIAAHLPHIFNSDGKAIDEAPEEAMDGRSHKKGPETETLDVGEVDGETLLFLANERPGVILVYKLQNNNITHPVFQSAHYAGGEGMTWSQLYEKRITRDVDPEDIRFLHSSISPNGLPLLIVCGTTSGTVSFYEVVNNDSQLPPGSMDRVVPAVMTMSMMAGMTTVV